MTEDLPEHPSFRKPPPATEAVPLGNLHTLDTPPEVTVERIEQGTLKVLLDNVQAGIVACNAEGILTLFNQAAREFHGLPKHPLPPEQWAEFYDLCRPDGKTPMPKDEIPLYRALQGEKVYNVEMVIAAKQRAPRMLLVSGQAIVDAQGNKRGAVVVMHDITERKQAEAELLISDTVLQQMPDAILLTDLEGKIQRWLGNAERIFGYTAAEAVGQPVSFLQRPDIQDEMTAQIIHTIQTSGEFCGEISCIRKDGSAVPIETTAKTVYDKDGNPIFFISINKEITERKQADAEREKLTRQQVQEQTARLAAEADLRRSTFLVEVSTALASSLDYEQTLQSVAQLVVPYFADWCSVDLLNDDRTISRVAVAHSDPDKTQLGWEMAQRFPRHLDDGFGISQVMRTGKSEIAIDITDAQLAAAVSNPEYLEVLRGVGLKSCIVAPLQARERVLGSISFVFSESNRHYSPDDLKLAEDLARRAAIAIDNARLYDTAQRAKQAAEIAADRTARLQTVTAALSESLTAVQVAEVIVEQSVAALEADAALMALLNPDGTALEVVQTVGYDATLAAQQQFPINAPFPLTEAVRTGQPVWSEPLSERLSRYPHLADAYKRLPFNAWISLPLMVEGEAVGGLSLSFKTFKQLSQSDREFILAISRQCAQAISRAKLYEAERKARAEAEQANRVKDEFLAVLSHELRSPLNPILGWSKLLQDQQQNPAIVTRGLQTIERNAKLQTQLIEDLLDVSRILQGKLSLDVTPVNLQSTIEAAMETVRLAAEAKSIDLKFETDDSVNGYEDGSVDSANASPIQVMGDASRLQQVVWNLLSNAVKFTPQGGRVEVRLEQVRHEGVDEWMSGRVDENPATHLPTHSYAQITISDTGKGITPQFLPHIFERFRQADSKTTRKFGGLGLGLAIVRQLVELHGGTVHVESAGEDKGATFTVTLPLIKAEVEKMKEGTHSLHPSSLTSQPLDGIRILVVDDEADARELMVFILEQAGAIVASAASAVEALQTLTESEIDVLISDIGMPDMDGYMLMRHVTAQFAAKKEQTLANSSVRLLDADVPTALNEGISGTLNNTVPKAFSRTVPKAFSKAMPKAIALTAYAGEMNQQKALAAGFQRHLSKPIEPDELINVIINLISSP